MKKNFAILLAGLIFFGIALMSLCRLIRPYPLVIGSFDVPFWGDFIGFFVAGLLSLGMFYSLRE